MYSQEMVKHTREIMDDSKSDKEVIAHLMDIGLNEKQAIGLLEKAKKGYQVERDLHKIKEFAETKVEEEKEVVEDVDVEAAERRADIKKIGELKERQDLLKEQFRELRGVLGGLSREFKGNETEKKTEKIGEKKEIKKDKNGFWIFKKKRAKEKTN